MTNGQRKKRDAIRHNLARDETLAYAQDRVEDPEKYVGVRMANRGSGGKLGRIQQRIVLMALAEMNYPYRA